MLKPRIGMCRGCGKVVKTGWQVVRPMDALPANRTWLQHHAVVSS